MSLKPETIEDLPIVTNQEQFKKLNEHRIFYIPLIRQLIRWYNNEEITMSKFVEVLNLLHLQSLEGYHKFTNNPYEDRATMAVWLRKCNEESLKEELADLGYHKTEWIGLYDKNGSKINKGDIIVKDNGVWGVIVWNAPFFEVTISENLSSLYTREWIVDSIVIGNIETHELPKLNKIPIKLVCKNINCMDMIINSEDSICCGKNAKIIPNINLPPAPNKL